MSSAVLYHSDKPISESDEKAIIISIALAHSFIDYLNTPSIIRKILRKKPYKISTILKSYYKIKLIPFKDGYLILSDESSLPYTFNLPDVTSLKQSVDQLNEISTKLLAISPVHSTEIPSNRLKDLTDWLFSIDSILSILSKMWKDKKYKVSFIKDNKEFMRSLMQEILGYIDWVAKHNLKQSFLYRKGRSGKELINEVRRLYEMHDWLTDVLQKTKELVQRSVTHVATIIDNLSKSSASDFMSVYKFNISIEIGSTHIAEMKKNITQPFSQLIEKLNERILPRIRQVENHYLKEINNTKMQFEEKINLVSKKYEDMIHDIIRLRDAAFRTLQVEIDILEKEEQKLKKRIKEYKEKIKTYEDLLIEHSLQGTSYRDLLVSDEKIAEIEKGKSRLKMELGKTGRELDEVRRELKELLRKRSEIEHEYNKEIDELQAKKATELKSLENELNSKIRSLENEKNKEIEKVRKPLQDALREKSYLENLIKKCMEIDSFFSVNKELTKELRFTSAWSDEYLLAYIIGVINMASKQIDNLSTRYQRKSIDKKREIEKFLLKTKVDINEIIEIKIPFWYIEITKSEKKNEKYSIVITPSTIDYCGIRNYGSLEYLIGIEISPIFPLINDLINLNIPKIIKVHPEKVLKAEIDKVSLSNIFEILPRDHWLIAKGIINEKLYKAVIEWTNKHCVDSLS